MSTPEEQPSLEDVLARARAAAKKMAAALDEDQEPEPDEPLGWQPFWQRHRYTRSKTFPRLYVVLAGKAEHLLDNRLQALAADVKGIAVAVWVNTLPRLQWGESWFEIGVDDPDRPRRRYPEPPGR
ncbi:hypothetical protein [Streptomyces hirsutus]|uniref:hypothetical protein n=1 Tax=Streptomyces hirsutus TaxID=35620 RepID=UPI00331C2A73